MSSISGQNIIMNGRSSRASSCGEIFTWNEISEIHKVRNGIYQRNGKLISLLTDFGKINPCYPDFHGETANTIFYTGAGRRGDQKLDSFNRAMFNAADSAHAVPLFNKLSVGRWEFLGFWRVLEGKYIFDEARQRMVWKFKLERQFKQKNAAGRRSSRKSFQTRGEERNLEIID
ncbi:MAG: YDG/SRA domain-containing protein [Pyrinomonadaceae bacterium]|nr:YDG/SRA domain-containing protein [Pyrinomonadaceae bacterium]